MDFYIFYASDRALGFFSLKGVLATPIFLYDLFIIIIKTIVNNRHLIEFSIGLCYEVYS